jgi:predicted DNA-binding ribbon-helix-helix protein
MRTTVDLDPDVLQAAKSLARDRNQSVGRVLSDLARHGLTDPSNLSSEVRNGVPLLPRRTGKTVTSETVRALLDAED